MAGEQPTRQDKAKGTRLRLYTGRNTVETCHRFIHQNAINYLICSILKYTFEVFKYFWWSPLLPSWSVFLYKPCHGSLHIFIDGKYILFLAKKSLYLFDVSFWLCDDSTSSYYFCFLIRTLRCHLPKFPPSF